MLSSASSGYTLHYFTTFALWTSNRSKSLLSQNWVESEKQPMNF